MVPSTAWGFRPESNNDLELAKKVIVVAQDAAPATTEEVPPAVEPEKKEEVEPKPPEDKMLHLDFIGTINRELIKPVHSQLNVNVKDENRHRLFLTFASPGGGIDPAFFIDSLIETWPLPSVAVCGSMNASASTILIAKRNLRLAYPNSRFMLHDAHGFNDGNPAEQKEKLRSYEELRNRAMEVYQNYIGLTKKEVERIVVRDTYFNAMEAMNLGTKGLIDGIIMKNLGRFKFEILMRNGIVKVVDLYNDDYISVKDLTVANVKAAADASDSEKSE